MYICHSRSWILKQLHKISLDTIHTSRSSLDGDLPQIELFKFFRTVISQLRMNLELFIVYPDPLTDPLLGLLQTRELLKPHDPLLDRP